MTRNGSLTLAMALCGTGLAGADVWDVQSLNDDTSATHNELVHGSSQVHDLGTSPALVADVDWYRIGQAALSSYEIVVDGTSGDHGSFGPDLHRVLAGGTILQGSLAVTPGVDYSRSLRWQNATTDAVDAEYVRVKSFGCTAFFCGSDDVYLIRAYETTYSIPRFNNSGSQLTVLQIQNPTAAPVDLTVSFWNASGAYLGSQVTTLAPRALLVVNTSTLSYAAGQSGAISVANTARYGHLAGKAVALEPNTGFTFDTPMVPRSN